jgi:putative transposase
MTKKKRHNEAEIDAKLREADTLAADGRTQSEIAKRLGVSIMTFHRWRKARSPLSPSRVAAAAIADEAQTVDRLGPERKARIAQLQLENTRLRKLVTDLLLEKMMLEDAQLDQAKRA